MDIKDIKNSYIRSLLIAAGVLISSACRCTQTFQDCTDTPIDVILSMQGRLLDIDKVFTKNTD